MSLSSLSLPKPDDWHVHLRDNALLKTVLPFTARQFARAVVMPNLKPPVVTTEQAVAYKARIMEALPPDTAFTPLMTIYLTDATNPDDLTDGFKRGLIFAAKLYPAGATTGSEHGVTSIEKILPVLDRLQRLDMPLLIHGEVVDQDIDFFDRETAFLDRVLIPLRRSFPALKIVLEHVSTRRAVQYVSTEGRSGRLAATITPHHLLLNRNALFEGGIHPHLFCLPVLKNEDDRRAVLSAAISGAPMFFAGTDSAPHPRQVKESSNGSGGIFSAPNALALYASVFEKANALDKLEAFLCRNGPAFYDLPVNTETITLEKTFAEPQKPILTKDGVEIIPFPQDSQGILVGPSWRIRKEGA